MLFLLTVVGFIEGLLVQFLPRVSALPIFFIIDVFITAFVVFVWFEVINQTYKPKSFAQPVLEESEQFTEFEKNQESNYSAIEDSAKTYSEIKKSLSDYDEVNRKSFKHKFAKFAFRFVTIGSAALLIGSFIVKVVLTSGFEDLPADAKKAYGWYDDIDYFNWHAKIDYDATKDVVFNDWIDGEYYLDVGVYKGYSYVEINHKKFKEFFGRLNYSRNYQYGLTSLKMNNDKYFVFTIFSYKYNSGGIQRINAGFISKDLTTVEKITVDDFSNPSNLFDKKYLLHDEYSDDNEMLSCQTENYSVVLVPYKDGRQYLTRCYVFSNNCEYLGYFDAENAKIDINDEYFASDNIEFFKPCVLSDDTILFFYKVGKPYTGGTYQERVSHTIKFSIPQLIKKGLIKPKGSKVKYESMKINVPYKFIEESYYKYISDNHNAIYATVEGNKNWQVRRCEVKENSLVLTDTIDVEKCKDSAGLDIQCVDKNLHIISKHNFKDYKESRYCPFFPQRKLTRKVARCWAIKNYPIFIQPFLSPILLLHNDEKVSRNRYLDSEYYFKYYRWQKGKGFVEQKDIRLKKTSNE